MPTPTLVATAGASNANSYATVAEADAYHDSRLHSEVWDDADDATTKVVALIMATRVLDASYRWASWPTNPNPTQALEWPRRGVLDRKRLTVVPDNVIPQELKNATAELARQLIASDRTLDSDVEVQGITSLTAGPVSLSFSDSVTAKVMPDAVVNLIPSWWGVLVIGGGGLRTVELARV